MQIKAPLNSHAHAGILKTALAILALMPLAALCACAGEPLVWERRPNRPAPAQFDVYHGETLDFSCAFEGFGALPFEGAYDVRLWYQTNGMGAAWWSVPATVSSNVLTAAWPPSADPGAGRVNFFFGAPSNAYAAAQVRFRNSPGPSPNNLDPPDVLDWQSELAAASNALARSIEAVATNLPPGMTTNDVCAIVTNATVTPTGDWVLDESRTYWESGITISEPLSWNGSSWVIEFYDGDMYKTVAAAGGFDALELNFYVAGPIATADIWYTRPGAIRNALGLAMESDLTNYVATVDVPDITNGLASATITNGLLGADAISTNNAAFVAAVTNCPVVIADPGDISGWGAYGTVGALLAALAAAITGLRTSKEDASNKVTSVSAQSTDAQYPSAKCLWDNLRYALISLTQDIGGGYALYDRAVNSVTVQSGVTSVVLVFPPAIQGMARDLIVRLDLTVLAAAPEVTIDLPTGETVAFETEDGAMPEFEAGKVNLVSFTETAPGVIAVAHKTMQEVA